MNEGSKLRKPCTHLAGEFFVAAELSRRGFNVAMTLGNAKRVDLLIEHENDTLPIQVKALRNRQSIGWPMPFKWNYNKELIFILVVLGKVNELPTYYIMKGEEAEKLTKSYKTRATLNISDVVKYKKNIFLNNWDLIEREFNKIS